jgi:HSP20 family molecular chaperone IbpA
MLSFEDDFDEIFDDFDIFNRKLLKKMRSDLDEIFEGIKSGKIKGVWETKEINEPEAKGYIIRGRFGSEDSLEPIDPLRPLRRRPAPEKPFEVPRNALEDMRDPLTDIFEEKNSIRVYMELPGEEASEIKVKVNGGNVEVRGKNFYKKIDLPSRNIDPESVTSDYKNGVLRITIQKKPELRDEDARKARMV